MVFLPSLFGCSLVMLIVMFMWRALCPVLQVELTLIVPWDMFSKCCLRMMILWQRFVMKEMLHAS